jgi:hypothetical protein
LGGPSGWAGDRANAEPRRGPGWSRQIASIAQQCTWVCIASCRTRFAHRHYLTKPDLNALYFATYQLPQLRGWKQPFTVGRYWRAALVVFFNYAVDTGTVFKSAGFH